MKSLTMVVLKISVLSIFTVSALAQNVVTRDPQALSIMSQMLVTAGGTKVLAAVQDFTGTGTVTFYWADQETGNVTIQGKGVGELRMDAVLPEGTRSVIVNDGSGFVLEADGRTEIMTYDGALKLGSATFPLLTALAQYQNSSVSLKYLGLVQHLGAPAYDIQFQTIYSSRIDPTGAMAERTTRDFFVDPNTLLPVGLLDRIDVTPNNPGISHELVFANWQKVNGMALPFWITESFGDQAVVTLQLSQVVFNTGIADTVFMP